MNNFLFKNIQSYIQFYLLRNEGLSQGPGPHEIAFIFVYVAFKKWFFLLLLWSASENWFVWRMCLTLCSGREYKSIHILLVSGWWSTVLFQPSVYSHNMDIGHEYHSWIFWWVTQTYMKEICHGLGRIYVNSAAIF